MRNVVASFLLLAVAPLGACRAYVVRVEADAVDREYSNPPAQVYAAVVRGAEAAGFQITSDKHDDFGGDLMASRGDGTGIRIHVKGLGKKRSRVSVRVEPADRKLAGSMHERIAGGLGLKLAGTAVESGGDSLDATYQATLASCTDSARHAVASFSEGSPAEEVHADWCRIDGRLKDSTPVRIRLEKLDERRTRVRLIVGDDRSDGNRAFALKIKREFDSSIRTLESGQ